MTCYISNGFRKFGEYFTDNIHGCKYTMEYTYHVPISCICFLLCFGQFYSLFSYFLKLFDLFRFMSRNIFVKEFVSEAAITKLIYSILNHLVRIAQFTEHLHTFLAITIITTVYSCSKLFQNRSSLANRVKSILSNFREVFNWLCYCFGISLSRCSNTFDCGLCFIERVIEILHK